MILASGGSDLHLAPEIGGTIVSWQVAGFDILRHGTPGGPRDQGSYPLIPFSNRVAGGAFTFEGKRHVLPTLLQPWAIHGAAWQCVWEGEGSRMTLDYPGGVLWPFAFHAEQTFDLSPRALTLTTRLVNRHSGPAPAAIGQHPYFARTPDSTLRFAARQVWRNNAESIPEEKIDVPPEWDFTTARTPDRHIDNCFLNWTGRFEITTPTHRVRVSADPVFRHLVVFTPEGQNFMAIEPVANMTDGLNRMDDPDCGMTVLEPGGVLEGRISFEVEV